MPGGNGMGPAGMDPMTGRAAGYCAGYGTPGFMNPIPGNSFGYGFGRGRGSGGGWGRRNRFYATGLTGWQRALPGVPAWDGLPAISPTKDQEMEMLKNQANAMTNSLEQINKRIQELETAEKK